MKKFYVFAAVAIAALASCTKSEVVYNQGQQEIGFRQFTGSMTKAEGTNLSDLDGGPETMGVFAHIWNSTNEEKVYFSNAKFVKPESGNSWGGDPKRYWPLKNELDFTVYAPWVEGTTYTHSSSSPELAVTVANNTDNQYDFLYGKQRYIQVEKTSNAVSVVLKHALSKLSFQVKSNVSDLFKITNVELVDAVQDGSFKVIYGYETSIAVTTGAIKGTCDVFDGNCVVKNDAYSPLGSKLVFPIGGPQNEAKLRITYNMESATGLVATVPFTNQSWDSGKHYIYNLEINATEILLSPTVEDWDEMTVEDPITIS